MSRNNCTRFATTVGKYITGEKWRSNLASKPEAKKTRPNWHVHVPDFQTWRVNSLRKVQKMSRNVDVGTEHNLPTRENNQCRSILDNTPCKFTVKISMLQSNHHKIDAYYPHPKNRSKQTAPVDHYYIHERSRVFKPEAIKRPRKNHSRGHFSPNSKIIGNSVTFHTSVTLTSDKLMV